MKNENRKLRTEVISLKEAISTESDEKRKLEDSCKEKLEDYSRILQENEILQKNMLVFKEIEEENRKLKEEQRNYAKKLEEIAEKREKNQEIRERENEELQEKLKKYSELLEKKQNFDEKEQNIAEKPENEENLNPE